MMILVTTALPYANGPTHLGHLMEQIQADIWVRFQKSRGNRCWFLCGDDAHGTPIMLSAEKQGITPEALIQRMHATRQKDFSDFHIRFDYYGSTHSAENEALCAEFYHRLQAQGDISTQKIEQAYDAQRKIFLPDRFVKGNCPRCQAADQYGDNCEICGATYTPIDLINPRSVLSNTTPIRKTSEHYFFQLDHHTTMLRNWIAGGHVQTEVANKLGEWFEAGLKPWNISRDAPYFGFEIPGTPGKYFYVWLDAPIGYIANTQNLCAQHPTLTFDQFWGQDSEVALYHFIGKDIIYFHSLFWPAMLHSTGYRKPTAIYAHGFLTINGKKMSKSRGSFITAQDYLSELNPEYLRYYFSTKLNGRIDDIDLNCEDFIQRINADLVGKVINIASRCAGFIHKSFRGNLSDTLHNPELLHHFIAQGENIAQAFQERSFHHAVRDIMQLADKANQYIDTYKPWILAKTNPNDITIHQVCSMGIHLFRIIMIYLAPILPDTTERAAAFLQTELNSWDARKNILYNHTIAPFQPLMQRIDADKARTILS